MKRPRGLRLVGGAAVVVVAAVVFLALAGSASATIDVAGWHFQDLSSHQIPMSFEAAFDSKKLASVKYSDQQADVYLLDLASGKETRVTDTPASEFDVALDGNRLAWVSREGDDFSKPATVWLHNLTAGTTEIIGQGRVADQPGLRIVGDHIAWAQYDQAAGAQNGLELALYVYTIGSGTTIRLTDKLAQGGGDDRGTTPYDLDMAHVAYVEAAPAAGDDSEVWLCDLGTNTRVKLGPTTARSGPSHVSLEGDLVTWSCAVTPETAQEQRTDIFLYTISTGVTTKIATVPYRDAYPKTDGRFVVWDTYTGGPVYTENLRTIEAYDSQTGKLIDVSHNAFLNFTPEISDGLVVWERGGELDSEIMACDLVSGQTTQLSANRTWVDQLAQVHGRTVIWWKHWMMTGPGVEPADEFVVATAPASYADPFADVPGDHRYRTAVLGLFDQGIAGGYKAATGLEFRPHGQLLRAQFAKMVCEAFDVPVSEDLVPPFTDLGPDDTGNLYPHEYVAALAATGVIKGKTATTFDPFAPVTRAQAVSILVRALDKFRPGVLEKVEAEAPGAYRWDPPHRDDLRKAYANDLLSSLVDWMQRWDAGVPCSRGEAAQLIWNALSLIDQVEG